jgi:hypothetical protein
MATSPHRPPKWAEFVIRLSVDGDYKDQKEYLLYFRRTFRRKRKQDEWTARWFVYREVAYWLLLVWPLRILKGSAFRIAK